MKSVHKRGNVIMDNEIKNVFFDIEMLRRRLIRPFFIELGLTVGQGQPRILKELREHGIMNQKELADACLMDVTTMSRTLDRMEKDGLLKRENNPASRRSWNVLLTDYGSQKADEVIRIFNRIDNVIYNGFSEEEVQTLSVMASKVEKNLWEAIKNEE
jgi:DNA-binding MarR family transcriptional regulator